MVRLVVGFAASLCIALSVCGADWPQWRGPDRANKVVDFTPPQTWPKQLQQKWKVSVGDGVASPVLVGGRLYIFARQGGDEVIQALNADTGEKLWSDKYAAEEIRGPAGGFKGPRGTPAVADGKVCTFGTAGIVSCWDSESGKLAWRKETKGTPGFKQALSPLIADGKCIVLAGSGGGGGGGKGGGKGEGKGEVIAFNLKDGSQAWKWEGEPPAYASPVLMTVGGTKIVVCMTDAGVVGLDLADGKQLFKSAFRSARYGNTVTPIVDGETLIYSAQGPGTVAAKVEKTTDGYKLKELWKSEQGPHMYNSPTLKDGRIYGLTGSGRGSSKLYCLDAKTGDVLWVDTATRGECGAVLDAGSVLLALSSDSNLLAFKPNDKNYDEVAKIKVSDSQTWAVPIVTGKRIYVKDKESLMLLTFE
jgi:outer membrane protein assembly factor BamB